MGHEPDADQRRDTSVCPVGSVALSAPAEVRQAEQARTQIDCTTTKVIMTDEAGSKGSVQVEERMTFWIDDAAKTFVFF